MQIRQVKTPCSRAGAGVAGRDGLVLSCLRSTAILGQRSNVKFHCDADRTFTPPPVPPSAKFKRRQWWDWPISRPLASNLLEIPLISLPIKILVPKFKIQKMFSFCSFLEPTSSIFGGPDMHVHEGSPVNISCIVQNAVGQPEFFFWYHNGQVRGTWNYRSILFNKLPFEMSQFSNKFNWEEGRR